VEVEVEVVEVEALKNTGDERKRALKGFFSNTNK